MPRSERTEYRCVDTVLCGVTTAAFAGAFGSPVVTGIGLAATVGYAAAAGASALKDRKDQGDG